jgi:hypothetical protein
MNHKLIITLTLYLCHFSSHNIIAQSDSLSVNQIIEKAIFLAPIHAKASGDLSAKVYMRNTGRWHKIPWLWEGFLRREGVQRSIDYVSEGVATYKVDSAQHYEFVFEGLRNNFKKQPVPETYVNPNFYRNILGTNAVSPLSTEAFRYYDFAIVSSDNDSYTIAIKPRKNQDERVFIGRITLSKNDFWIKSVDLNCRNYGIDYRFEITYSAFEQGWLPTQTVITSKGAVMGFEGTYTHESITKEYQFGTQQINLPPMGYDYQEAVNIQERNFEVMQFRQVFSTLGANLKQQWADANMASGMNRNDKLIIGTDATQKNEDFWKSFEQVFDKPLLSFNELPLEARSKSSLPAQPIEFSTYRQANLPLNVGAFLFSRSYFWGNSEKGFYPHELYYKSPVLDFNFNTVEGFVFNTGILYRLRTDRYRWFEIDPTWRYSFNTGQSSGTLRIRWKTPNTDFGFIGGRFISQYNADTPIPLDLNSLSTLLLKRNFVKIYEKDFFNVNYLNRFSNNLSLRTSIEYARRYPRANITNYSWIEFPGVDYTSNFPKNEEIRQTDFVTNDIVGISLQLNYRPNPKHQYRNDWKNVDLSSVPMFTFKYRGALPIAGTKNDFHTIELGIMHNFPIGLNTTFNYIAQAGTFLSIKQLTFADFKHFNGNNNMIPIGQMLTTHRLVGFYDNYIWGASKKLIDHYQYSTDGSYIDIMTMWGFRKLALSQLPFVRRKGIREELFTNFLYTGNQGTRILEFGYGIDGILRIFRVEACWAFVNERFSQFGIRVAINSRLRLGVTPEW